MFVGLPSSNVAAFAGHFYSVYGSLPPNKVYDEFQWSDTPADNRALKNGHGHYSIEQPLRFEFPRTMYQIW